MTRWLRGWMLAGLVAPVVHFFIYLIFGYTLGEGIVIFWPGSIGLMVLENNPPKMTVFVVLLISIASNVLLYFVIGILLWPLVHNKSGGASAGEKTK